MLAQTAPPPHFFYGFGGYLYDISHTYVTSWLASFGAGLIFALLGMELLAQGERAQAAAQVEFATPQATPASQTTRV